MSANQNEKSKDNTGTSDITYDLVSAIYHALQGAETEARYIADAEATGDQETVEFFRKLKEDNSQRADQAKRLLAKHLGQQQPQGQAASGGGGNS